LSRAVIFHTVIFHSNLFIFSFVRNFFICPFLLWFFFLNVFVTYCSTLQKEIIIIRLLLGEKYSTAGFFVLSCFSLGCRSVSCGTVDKLYYTYYAHSLCEIVSFVVNMLVLVQSLRIIINNCMTKHRHSMYRNISIQLPYVFALPDHSITSLYCTV